MALSASYYEIWLPILLTAIGAVITYLATRQGKKFAILKRVFVFIKEIIQLFGEKLSGGITAQEWEEIISEAIDDFRDMILDIAETFKVGESAQLDEAKEAVIEDEATITWTETKNILAEKEEATSTIKKIKNKVTSINLKKK
jgi:hypothetical protein